MSLARMEYTKMNFYITFQYENKRMDVQRKYDLLASKKIGDMKTYNEIKEGKELSVYKDCRAQEAMWIEFEIRDVEITEGEHKCYKCKSRKVYVASIQNRGGDEAMCHYAKCANQRCNNVWTL